MKRSPSWILFVATLLTVFAQTVVAEEAAGKPQYKYPDVWARVYPDPNKERVLQIFRVVDGSKKSWDFPQAKSEVIM